MINIIDFNREHIEEARELVIMNYCEERTTVISLPQVDVFPDLECFADNGLGVAMFIDDKMVGFLCCCEPWNNAFNSNAKGTFSPIHAHGAISENRDFIYKKLYQAAAEKWVKTKISYHAIALYAHDSQAINALFTYGFGLRCIDAIRPLANFEFTLSEDVTFKEITQANVSKVRNLRKLLKKHMVKSPCFMYFSDDDFDEWLKNAEMCNSRIFIAQRNDNPIAFIEITDDGETFVSESNNMMNICGAYCLPEYRGKGIMQGLLNNIISKLRADGYCSLGVDFESINPTANSFWLKHFTAYTNSVTRRIDECAMHE